MNYSIGDVSRRTGLPVSAIRYYSDAGLVTPVAHTGAGYRRYDISAVARLELIRTLRDLGSGLDDIRRLLAAETTLHDLASAHLAVVEEEMRRFRARRAVLRTVVRVGAGAEQVALMHRLASMSDEDRASLIDDFWAEVTGGLEFLRPARPVLPEEPTSAQLEAWIELAGTVSDADFRRAVRGYFESVFPGSGSASPPAGEQWTEAEAARQVEILTEARVAQAAGVAVDSPEARALATRFLAAIGGGRPGGEVSRQLAGVDVTAPVARYGELLGRYHALVAAINGTPVPALTAPGMTWLHDAITAMS